MVEKDSTAIASNVPKIDLSLQWHANFLDTVLILEILPDISSINHSDFVICADQAAEGREGRDERGGRANKFDAGGVYSALSTYERARACLGSFPHPSIE